MHSAESVVLSGAFASLGAALQVRGGEGTAEPHVPAVVVAYTPGAVRASAPAGIASWGAVLWLAGVVLGAVWGVHALRTFQLRAPDRLMIGAITRALFFELRGVCTSCAPLSRSTTRETLLSQSGSHDPLRNTSGRAT